MDFRKEEKARNSLVIHSKLKKNTTNEHFHGLNVEFFLMQFNFILKFSSLLEGVSNAK